MEKTRTYSLRFRIIILLLASFFFFANLLIYNNSAAFSLLIEKVCENTQNTAVLYQKELDENLKRVETWLYSTALDTTDLFVLKDKEIHTTEWFRALSRFEEKLSSALPLYITDGFFCYLPTKDLTIHADQENGRSSLSVRSALLNSIQKGTADLSSWQLLAIDGQYFFSRILHINDVYIGSWVLTDTLLNAFASKTAINTSLFFASSDGLLLQSQETEVFVTLPSKETIQYCYEKINGQEVLSVSQPLESGSFYLILLIPRSDLTDNNHSLMLVICIVFWGCLLIWFFLFVLLKSWVIKPVRSIANAIEELRSGNMQTFVSYSHPLNEFANMIAAFNDMVKEIEHLKIDVYERKLQRQRLETQFLKQQITPHFMINCLNTACQLTESNRSELARRMLKDLSHHLRYTLSSGHTVALKQEIQLLKNYIELSNIRYPDSIKLILNCPEHLLHATAIPLLLLNFAENTIKYEVVAGEVLEIYIVIYETSNSSFHISIWDTGQGFSENMLNKLQNIEEYLEREDYHIGISNVILRARHVYPKSAFSFCNRPGAGAQIDIELPLLPFEAVKENLYVYQSADCR